MKVSKLSLVFGIGSLAWLVMAVQRWWFKYPDTSQLILGIVIGIIGLGASYIHNWMRVHHHHFEDFKERVHGRLDGQYDEIEELRKKIGNIPSIIAGKGAAEFKEF